MGLPGGEFEVYFVQRAHAREAFADTARFHNCPLAHIILRGLTTTLQAIPDWDEQLL